MAIQNYRLDISVPSTNVKQAFSLSLSPQSGNVIRIETELKRNDKISYLTARIFDKGQAILSSLPDIAFFDLPIQLYLSKPGSPLSVSGLVFDGTVTALSFGYPSPETITLTAHDNSIHARKKSGYRTIKDVTSVQLVKIISKHYGYTVDSVDIGNVKLKRRTIAFGPNLNDYIFMYRALLADGLDMVMTGTSISIMQGAKVPYNLTFKRNQAPVLSFECTINHVSSGTGSNKTGAEGGASIGNIKALTPESKNQNYKFDNALAKLSDSEDVTHRSVPSAPESSDASHNEDAIVKHWTNRVTSMRRRKDTATLTLTATPDINLKHVVNIEGWGAKVDHTWWIDSVKHSIVGGDGGPATTVLSLAGPPSKAAAKQVGSEGGADIDQIKKLGGK